MYWTDIAERRSGDIVILDLRGNMTLCDSPGRLFAVIDRLVQQGESKILLNLFHLSYIDSQGLADVIQGFTVTKRAGGALKLCRIAERIRELLILTELSTIIEVFDSEQGALNSFRHSGA